MINDPLDVFIKDFSENDEVVFEWDGGMKKCLGIFDNSFIDAQLGETIMDTTIPRLTCKHEDVRSVPREAVVVIRGKTYSVVQVQPDGTGFAMVHLAYE
jgi:hypothetical protein